MPLDRSALLVFRASGESLKFLGGKVKRNLFFLVIANKVCLGLNFSTSLHKVIETSLLPSLPIPFSPSPTPNAGKNP